MCVCGDRLKKLYSTFQLFIMIKALKNTSFGEGHQTIYNSREGSENEYKKGELQGS